MGLQITHTVACGGKRARTCFASSIHVPCVVLQLVLHFQTHQRRPLRLGVEICTRHIDVHCSKHPALICFIAYNPSNGRIPAYKSGLSPLSSSRSTMRVLTRNGSSSNASSCRSAFVSWVTLCLAIAVCSSGVIPCHGFLACDTVRTSHIQISFCVCIQRCSLALSREFINGCSPRVFCLGSGPSRCSSLLSTFFNIDMFEMPRSYSIPHTWSSPHL